MPIHPWIKAWNRLVTKCNESRGNTRARLWEMISHNDPGAVDEAALGLCVDISLPNFYKYLNFNEDDPPVQNLPWELALIILKRLGLGHLRIDDLTSIDMIGLDDTASGCWHPSSYNSYDGKAALSAYIQGIRETYRSDRSVTSLVFGYSPTFLLMTSSVQRAYCEYMIHVNSRSDRDANRDDRGGANTRPAGPIMVAAYEKLCNYFQSEYKEYGDNPPKIDNYIPDAAYRQLVDPHRNTFGTREQRKQQITDIRDRTAGNPDGYRLFIVDDFALMTDPYTSRSLSDHESIMLVKASASNGILDATDVNCQGFCSRRNRDMSIVWSKARDAVDHCEQFFNRLIQLDPKPRQVTADELLAAADKL